jgi:hypothetical protein
MNASIPRFLLMTAGIAAALTASAHASIPARRYILASRTVYDAKTRLTWQQSVLSTALYTWANAKTYCAGAGTSLGGSGWRLPTLGELRTIIDYSHDNPSIDSAAFPSTPATLFWSSSPVAGSSSGAWGITFDYGYANGYRLSNNGNVRCVRGK